MLQKKHKIIFEMSEESWRKSPLNQDDALHTLLYSFNNKAEFQYNIFLLLGMSVVACLLLLLLLLWSSSAFSTSYFSFFKFYSLLCTAKINSFFSYFLCMLIAQTHSRVGYILYFCGQEMDIIKLRCVYIFDTTGHIRLYRHSSIVQRP